jgi:hypothetical protein
MKSIVPFFQLNNKGYSPSKMKRDPVGQKNPRKDSLFLIGVYLTIVKEFLKNL